MTIDRACEILDPEHREHYDSIEPVNEACRMAIKALRMQEKEPNIGRKYAFTTGLCPMCEDCPDGCPILTPNDSRNAQEKEPCGWCKHKLRFECYLIDDDGYTASIKNNIVQTVIAEFCPMCGRPLKGEKDGKTDNR